MHVFTTLAELRHFRRSLSGTLGLVPTMGYLHTGHLSLAQRAKQDCEHVGVSIFVNPTQFGPAEDLSKYPRNIARDLALLESAGVAAVWTPTPEELYPANFQTWVTVEEVTKPLEGHARPGHFRGVTTIVAKLFNAFTPDKAYFGQKDAQQAVVIQQMARDLNFPLEVVVCPTVREADGLAMSSRNAYLTAEERQAATVLHRALSAAKARYDSGERDADALRAVLSSTLAHEPLAREEYVSVADPLTLAELSTVEQRALLSMAVRVGKARLIDNFVIG
jgi:pantoate--beta-alanine ligase